MTERPEKIQYQTDPERQEQVLYEHYRFYAGYGQEPLRIDKFLMNKISHISRSRIQEGIKANQVLINDTPVKSNHKVKAGQTVKVVLPRPPEDMVLKAEAIPLDLVYEDHYVVVVNKPAGMVVHPGINNHSGTLVNALMHYFHTLPETINGHDRPGIVHRIDKETSGLLVVAKQNLAINSLFDQFAQKTVDRQYLALVWGEPACDSGTIEGNLARSERNRKAMAVYEDPETGKPAVTHYQVIARFGYASLVKCVLETGRTHHIRAGGRAVSRQVSPVCEQLPGSMPATGVACAVADLSASERLAAADPGGAPAPGFPGSGSEVARLGYPERNGGYPEPATGPGIGQPI